MGLSKRFQPSCLLLSLLTIVGFPPAYAQEELNSLDLATGVPVGDADLFEQVISEEEAAEPTNQETDESTEDEADDEPPFEDTIENIEEESRQDNNLNQSGATRKMLPTPVGLDRDVKFWEFVFEMGDPNRCIFHDSLRLDVVYGVEAVSKTKAYRNRRGRVVRNSDLQQKKANIAKILAAFAAGRAPASLAERRILDAIPRELRNRAFFLQAKDRVRCQRGVDLGPSIARSQRYIGMIKKEFDKRGLPADLAYLPHLESGFNVRAHSKAGAKGIWQFTKAGAATAGLKVQYARGSARKVVIKGKKGRQQSTTRYTPGRLLIDERIDPYKSTLAAASHFSRLHGETGSWPLAITAYNYGHNGVARAIDKFGPDYMRIRTHHRTRIFGFASKNYYPSFLAVRNVALRYEKTGVLPGGRKVREAQVASAR